MPVLADQQELIYNRTVQTQDAVWNACWDSWMKVTDGKRESGKLVQTAQVNDDDDDDIVSCNNNCFFAHRYIFSIN